MGERCFHRGQATQALVRSIGRGMIIYVNDYPKFLARFFYSYCWPLFLYFCLLYEYLKTWKLWDLNGRSDLTTDSTTTTDQPGRGCWEIVPGAKLVKKSVWIPLGTGLYFFYFPFWLFISIKIIVYLIRSLKEVHFYGLVRKLKKWT